MLTAAVPRAHCGGEGRYVIGGRRAGGYNAHCAPSSKNARSCQLQRGGAGKQRHAEPARRATEAHGLEWLPRVPLRSSSSTSRPTPPHEGWGGWRRPVRGEKEATKLHGPHRSTGSQTGSVTTEGDRAMLPITPQQAI